MGDEHERTRESAQVLKHLTEQAVVLQKRMNDVLKGQLLVIPSITVSDVDKFSFFFFSHRRRPFPSIDSTAEFSKCFRNVKCGQWNSFHSN